MIRNSLILILLTILLFSCSNNDKNDDEIIVKIGHVGEYDYEIWDSMKDDFLKNNVILETVYFSDYQYLNSALDNRDIDLNVFQNYAFFVDETNRYGYNLSIISKTYIARMNMYSRVFTNIGQISMGAKIAVPKSSVNLSRALKILDSIGFVRLKEINDNNMYNYKLDDIRENYLHLDFILTEGSKIYSIMDSVDAAFVNYSYSHDFDNENIIYYDDPSKYASDTYVNLIVSRDEDEFNELYIRISESYKEKIRNKINENKLNGLIMADY